MALGGLFGKKADEEVSPHHSDSDNAGFGKGYGGFAPDTEKQDTNAGPRKMSRIDRPVTKSISGNIAGGRRDSDTDPIGADVSVGKQLEMEEGNAIKYRTCSWPKV